MCIIRIPKADELYNTLLYDTMQGKTQNDNGNEKIINQSIKCMHDVWLGGIIIFYGVFIFCSLLFACLLIKLCFVLTLLAKNINKLNN